MKQKIYKSTNSYGKRYSTEWAKNKSKIGKKGEAIYLCGPDLLRHVKDKKELGIKDTSKHIIVEITLKTYKSLLQKAKKINFRGTIINNNLLEVVKNYKGKISHLDFDACNNFGEIENKVIDLILEKQIPNTHIVVSTRTKSKFLKSLERKFNLKPQVEEYFYSYRKTPIRSFTILQKRTIEKFLNKKLKNSGYNFGICPYPGAGSTKKNKRGTPMLMIVIQKVISSHHR